MSIAKLIYKTLVVLVILSIGYFIGLTATDKERSYIKKVIISKCIGVSDEFSK